MQLTTTDEEPILMVHVSADLTAARTCALAELLYWIIEHAPAETPVAVLRETLDAHVDRLLIGETVTVSDLHFWCDRPRVVEHQRQLLRSIAPEG